MSHASFDELGQKHIHFVKVLKDQTHFALIGLH